MITEQSEAVSLQVGSGPAQWSAAPPSAALQAWSIVLPVLKCAVCPACLSIFGGLFAGARMGFVGFEQFHGWIIAVALVADFFILRVAMKHHNNAVPLTLCVSGGTIAVAGHFTSEWVEYLGFALLMIAAFYNVYLLRQHRKEGGACCAHDHFHHAAHQPVVGHAHEHG